MPLWRRGIEAEVRRDAVIVSITDSNALSSLLTIPALRRSTDAHHELCEGRAVATLELTGLPPPAVLAPSVLAVVVVRDAASTEEVAAGAAAEATSTCDAAVAGAAVCIGGGNQLDGKLDRAVGVGDSASGRISTRARGGAVTVAAAAAAAAGVPVDDGRDEDTGTAGNDAVALLQLSVNRSTDGRCVVVAAESELSPVSSSLL